MDIFPLEDRVVVKRSEAVTQTKGGIYIPETSKDSPTTGEVLKIGEVVSKVKIGDNILFPKYAGVDVLLEDNVHVLIVKEEEILAILKDTPINEAG